jgi:cytochrome c-type biogenesis protein CcmH/NrfG
LGLFWFLAGILSTLAALILLLPWLRKIPRLGPLPTLPWQAGIGAGLMIAAILGLYILFGRADSAIQSNAAGQTSAPAANAASAASAAGAFADAVNQSGNLASTAPKAAAAGPASKAAAGSMGSAIASLEARLAKSGGSADDWELLAKSYEFLGRPQDAAKARARQLPPLPPDADETPIKPAAAAIASGTAVSGEISLAPPSIRPITKR